MFLQFPHLHLASLGHWRVSDWRRRQRGFLEVAARKGWRAGGRAGGAPAAGRPCPQAGPQSSPPPQLQARGPGPGLLGLSRWLVSLFAAPWQEGAGEAGESSGRKEGGKWPAWLPAARRHPKYENREEGSQALENWAGEPGSRRGRGYWERDGGQRSWVQPTLQRRREGLVPQASPQAHVNTNHSRPGGYRPQVKATPAHAHLSDPQSPQTPTEGPSC